MKHKKILIACFGCSLFMHAAALVCFQKYSLWFSSSQTAQSAENWLSLVDKKDRDQILKSAFDPTCDKESNAQEAIKPIHEKEVALSIEPKLTQALLEPKNSIFFQLSFPMTESLLTSHVLPTFSIPHQSFNLLEHLPQDLMIPSISKPTPPMFLPVPTKPSVTLVAKPSLTEETPRNAILYSDALDLSLIEEPEGTLISSIPLPNLPKLPTLAELETTSCSESFDADLVFLPKDNGKGYIFALTLIPRPDLNLPKLKQHFTFLIDRSNSIQQNRLSITKSAVNKALDALPYDDTFNIIAFDNKMDKMSPHYLPCTNKSFAVAEEFLEKIQLGSFFATSDISKPLFLTVPGHVDQNEIHTAILLTDGETLSKKTMQRAIFSDWTAYNGGKVTLFTVSMHDPHIAKLEAIAAMNRGKLINAPTHRGLKRKLLKLLKTIGSPIAKNISCHGISRTPTGSISLFPLTSQMPHLYLDQPYVILGESDSLDDFILFVQGRLKDRWLNIKKTISFLNAKKGSKSLKQEWAQQLVYQLYEQFSIDENPKHLADAKALLEPFDMQVAFQ